MVHGSALEPSLQASLRAISDEWLSARHGTEMTFDLGSFAPDSLKRAELCVLFDEKNLPIAFASWLSYARATGRSIDLMRHLSTHRGVMDALIAKACWISSGVASPKRACGTPCWRIQERVARQSRGKGHSLPIRAVRHLLWLQIALRIQEKVPSHLAGPARLPAAASPLTYCLRRPLSCACICPAVFSNTSDPEISLVKHGKGAFTAADARRTGRFSRPTSAPSLSPSSSSGIRCPTRAKKLQVPCAADIMV